MDFNTVLRECRAFMGLERNTTSHNEKLISAVGAFLGILVVYWISSATLTDSTSKTFIITSMGASAVLLFAVPHGALSQPWAVIGGNVISAIIGVSCHQLLSDSLLCAATAVGLAVGAMHYLRCIHPPGGATALTAAIGGEQIQAMGYQYVITPVLMNVLAILGIAIAFNLMFSWRRYPVHIAKRHSPSSKSMPSGREYELTQEDFAAAMQQLDSYVDVTSEGLTELLELAKQHGEKSVAHPKVILPGRYYSNGKIGKSWSIRRVIDEAEKPNPRKDTVIYKVVAGAGAYGTAMCLRSELQQWARFEVIDENGRWIKVAEEEA